MQPHHQEKFRLMLLRRLVVVAAVVLIFKVASLQLLDISYSQQATALTLYNKTLYPSRGLIYDRNETVLVYNDPVYTIEVIEQQLRPDFDVERFCTLLGIDTSTFHRAMHRMRNDRYHSPRLPATFLQHIPPEQFVRLGENLHEFPGVSYVLQNVRGYPVPVAPHVLGYISEVDQATIDTSDKVYVRGDYIGTTGLERIYEHFLRGQKGISYVLKDNLGREVGRVSDGKLDSAAISGLDLYITLDAGLQAYGQQLMHNKRGGIVCIEPATGEVLAMITAPAYDPNLLTIHPGRSSSYMQLVQDSLNPLFDRAMMAAYPPGSIFKTILALIAMQEGVLTPRRTIACDGGYHFRNLRVGCHNHPTAMNVPMSIQHSCNAYYVQVYRDVIDQDGFTRPGAGLERLNGYLAELSLGVSTGIDLPHEKGGNIPWPEYFDRIYGTGAWRSTFLVSMGIGQGELALTTLQMANMTAAIANRGYYYTPHLLRGVDAPGMNLPEAFVEKHVLSIDPEHFEPVIDGMERAVTWGTASSAYIAGISVCGKTGTSQNPHGRDHSVFIAFAPKDNPKIAIAVYVENGGWGGTIAAPLAGLMIEMYLTGAIAANRKWLETRMLETSLLTSS